MVGTVIDPELTDELKVTVVATGLGQAEEAQMKLVEPKKVPMRSDGTVDYRDMDRPTIMRKQAPRTGKSVAQSTGVAQNMDILDIPAFLRRQAD